MFVCVCVCMYVCISAYLNQSMRVSSSIWKSNYLDAISVANIQAAFLLSPKRQWNKKKERKKKKQQEQRKWKSGKEEEGEKVEENEGKEWWEVEKDGEGKKK